MDLILLAAWCLCAGWLAATCGPRLNFPLRSVLANFRPTARVSK